MRQAIEAVRPFVPRRLAEPAVIREADGTRFVFFTRDKVGRHNRTPVRLLVNPGCTFELMAFLGQAERTAFTGSHQSHVGHMLP